MARRPWARSATQPRFASLHTSPPPVSQERDELFEKFESTIYDVQQKSGFKNILLEKKLQVCCASALARAEHRARSAQQRRCAPSLTAAPLP